MNSPHPTTPVTRPTLTTEEWRRVFELYDGGAEGEVGGDEPEAIRTALAYLRNTRMRNAPETREFESVANSMASSVLGLSEPVRGATLGRYRLIEPIAQGGMGSVWRGERSDGLVSQNVAIKLLGSLAISRQARARFIREGELLAKLNHPNIARLHDVGLTEDGQRFLVIELIDGEDITAFCRGKTREETLAVFRQLLSAVAYSHSQLVLHRDIKPANVLVDRSGQVKLLDFGVAKLADDEGDDEGLTRSMGRALTERYAAPEQFVDDNVGTSADVFALGSLLVELLSGERIEWTHPKKEWVNASLAVALKTSLANVPDDLRAIASKATSREPAERYASVGEFDDDVARFLASEPVRARPASAWYRFTKFVRRHRGSFGAGVAAALAVVASLVFAVVQLIEARKQEQIAQTEAAKAKEIAKFTTGLFTVLDPKVASNVDRSKLTAKEILDAGRARIKTELHDQPEVRIAMLGTMVEIYGRLGDERQFTELLNEQIALAKAHYGEFHPIVYEAQSLDLWSDLYGGLYADARRKLMALDATAHERGETGAIGDERAASRLFAWARISEKEGKDTSEEVVKRYEAAIAEFIRAKSSSADFSAARASYATALVNANQLDRAVVEYSEAIAAFERAQARNSKDSNIGDLSIMLLERGKAYATLKRPIDAERDMRRSIELMIQSTDPDHVLTKEAQAELALFLHRQERRDEAWQLFARIDATAPTIVIGTRGMEFVQQVRARMLARENKFDASLDALAAAIAGWKKAENNPVELANAEQLRTRIEGMRAERKSQSPSR